MSIEQFMKKHNGIRLDYGGKWLVWSMDEWVVYQKVYRKSMGQIVLRTESIERALEELAK